MNIPNLKHFRRKVIARAKRHIKKVSQLEYEKGDIDFVDERVKPKSVKKEKSFFDFLFSFISK